MKSITKLTPILAAGVMLFASTAAQAAGSFSVSGSGSHTVGTPFTVVVSENSGTEEVNAVNASVSFNGPVQITGVAAGEFGTCPVAPSASGNTVTFSCAALGGHLTGSHTVGTITVKPLSAGSASASVSGTLVDANTNQAAAGIAGGSASYSFANASNGGGSNGGSTGSTGSNGTKTATPTPAASSKATPSASPAVAGASDAQTPSVSPKANSSHETLVAASEVKPHTGRWILAGILVILAGAAALYLVRRNRIGQVEKA